MEIIIILVIALIVIPPDRLPDVMRGVAKILRELRLASNLVVRELSGVMDEPAGPRMERKVNPMADPIGAASSAGARAADAEAKAGEPTPPR